MKIASRKKKPGNSINIKLIVFTATGLLMNLVLSAQDKTAAKDSPSLFTNSLFLAFSMVAFVLAIVIVAYTETVKAAAHMRVEMEKKKKDESSSQLKTVLTLLIMTAFSGSLFSQTAAFAVPEAIKTDPAIYMVLSPYVFYIMVSIIALELIVIAWLYMYTRQLMGVREAREKKLEAEAKLGIRPVSLMEKLNASVALDKEADIMMDHEYDGIRELDNDLPPWWKYGFYLTIVVSIVYMVHYHISGTGKLQIEEYESQLAQAETEAAEFKKKSTNLVDENNVIALTDEAALAGGKLVFETHCSACHGKAGEGTVGPNLTDDYWLHKGSIKDVFRSVKYGWPEKGMKSWQQDLGARQIHEVSSYIMSLHGTNPANAKEKQGELYMDESMSDTAKVAGTDSLKLVGKDKVNE